MPQISTKDGTTNKNARLFNMLKEVSKTGEKAVIRPGLEVSDTYPGLGSGLIVFDGRLLVVADDTIYGDSEWPLDSPTWAVGTTYAFGDSVWYLGDLYFSMSDGNVGNVPGTSSTWSSSLEETDFNPDTVYGIGDTITINGVTYYSYAPNNQNRYPGTGNNSVFWGTTAPTSSRFQASITTIGLTGAGNPGAECASRDAAAFSAYSTATAMISCATKSMGTSVWYNFVGVELRAGTYYVRATQYTDPVPDDCSGTPLNGGTIDIGTVAQTV